MSDSPFIASSVRTLTLALAGGMLLCAAPALAAPGAGDEIYAATVEPGEWELEARFGRLAGGPDGGAENARLEAAYGLTGNLRLAVVGEFERDPGGPRRATAAAIEAVYHLAHHRGWDLAVYGEVEKGLNGNPDAVETKLLVERRGRSWDLRVNLIAEQPLRQGEPLEFGYAVSLDRAVSERLRLGLAGFGELGTHRRLIPYTEHYLGPVAKWRPGGHGSPLKLETGWLFPLAEARDHAKGQFRLNLEWEL